MCSVAVRLLQGLTTCLVHRALVRNGTRSAPLVAGKGTMRQCAKNGSRTIATVEQGEGSRKQ